MYTHEKLKRLTSDAMDETSDSRELSEKCRDYYDGHQFTAAQIAVLKARGQDPRAWNRVRSKVDAMVGIEQQSRTDPSALPRTPQDTDAAEVATKSLIFIDDNTRFDHKASGAFENLLIEGTGAVDLIAEEKRGRMEIMVDRIRWEELVYDPHSREKDFSDAGYLGRTRWMYVDEAVNLYGSIYEGDDLVDILMGSTSADGHGETYEDRPVNGSSNFSWVDKRLRRVRIVSLYYKKDGTWHFAIFCGGGQIYNQVSPYLDEDGEPTCTIEAMSAYVDRNNTRHGIVPDMLGPQNEINQRRSKALHMFTTRQTVSPQGAVTDRVALKRELSNPNGHIEYDMDKLPENFPSGVKPFDILPNGDQAQGQFALLNEAKAEIDQRGPNAALQGQLAGNQSGRAIRAQQQAGFAEMAPIYDILNDWRLRCYRAMWARMRQFWTEERYIRISGESGQQEFMAINQVAGFQPQAGPDGVVQLVPQFENRLGEMDVDVIIDSTPDYATIMEQSFEQLTQMAQAGVPIPPDLIIEASSLPNKRDVMERMGRAQQQQQRAQGQAAQIEQQERVSKIRKDDASTMKTVAEAQKTQLDTQLTAVGLA